MLANLIHALKSLLQLLQLRHQTYSSLRNKNIMNTKVISKTRLDRTLKLDLSKDIVKQCSNLLPNQNRKKMPIRHNAKNGRFFQSIRSRVVVKQVDISHEE